VLLAIKFGERTPIRAECGNFFFQTIADVLALHQNELTPFLAAYFSIYVGS